MTSHSQIHVEAIVYRNLPNTVSKGFQNQSYRIYSSVLRALWLVTRVYLCCHLRLLQNIFCHTIDYAMGMHVTGLTTETSAVKLCTIVRLCGVICASIRVVKVEWRKREDGPGIWITSGIMKFVTVLVVQFTPDTEFHKICCLVCALGLIIAIFGALLDLLLSCCVQSPQREMSQGLMAVGTLMSFLSILLKASEYFWS